MSFELIKYCPSCHSKSLRLLIHTTEEKTGAVYWCSNCSYPKNKKASNGNHPSFDTDMGAGIGPFKFGDTPEAREHDLGSLMCSTEECHRENDENFLKNLWFKFKKKRTVGHLWETGQGYAVKTIAALWPFWHKPYSRLEEWLKWTRQR